MNCGACGVGGMLRRAGDNIITHRRRCSRIGDDVEEVLLLIECDLVEFYLLFCVRDSSTFFSMLLAWNILPTLKL